MMLYSEQIRSEILDNSLITGCLNLERQLQPRGFDLTLGWVDAPVADGGYEGWLAAGGDCSFAPHSPLNYDSDGWLYLPQGSYVAMLNELLQLPVGLMARAYPNPNLARCGVSLLPSVWESGFKGRVQTMMLVNHRAGFRIQRDAPIMRMLFQYLPIGKYSRETITLGAG